MNSNIDWNDVIKKEARGINDADLGEVQGVSNGFVLTQRGLIDLEVFNIPQEKAESYDGRILRFSVSEDEALNKYRGESTETLSQSEDSTTSTLNDLGTPLQDKDTDRH
ncbi:MAG: hypothetical protein M3Y25_09130 [Thermoproteota archaeon]|nr:hypothetical protein [Thermoproteota archaeon]